MFVLNSPTASGDRPASCQGNEIDRQGGAATSSRLFEYSGIDLSTLKRQISISAASRNEMSITSLIDVTVDVFLRDSSTPMSTNNKEKERKDETEHIRIH